MINLGLMSCLSLSNPCSSSCQCLAAGAIHIVSPPYSVDNCADSLTKSIHFFSFFKGNGREWMWRASHSQVLVQVQRAVSQNTVEVSQRWATLCHRAMRVCKLSFQAKTRGFQWIVMLSVKLPGADWKPADPEPFTVHGSPNFFFSFLIFMSFVSPLAPSESTVPKENNQILVVLFLFSVVDNPPPRWLSKCTVVAWGLYEGVIVCVCDMMSVCTGRQSLSFTR